MDVYYSQYEAHIKRVRILQKLVHNTSLSARKRKLRLPFFALEGMRTPEWGFVIDEVACQYILRFFSTFVVHLNFLQVFLYVHFITEKNQKVPAHGKSSRTLLCSGVVNNILQSKSPCHLNLSVDFWVMRTFLS